MLFIFIFFIFFIFLYFDEIKFLFTIFTDPFFNRMTIYDLRARVPQYPYKLIYKLIYYWNTCSYKLKNINIQHPPNVRYRILKKDNKEENMPHTLGNYVILPYDFDELPIEQKIEILNHEYIHILQKRTKNNKECISLLIIDPLRRNNPDTDDCFVPGYLWSYSSEYPKNVNDIIKLSKYEHPFEEEAYGKN